METWTAPSRKWLAARITAAGGLAIAWIEAGGWDTTLGIATVTMVVEAAVAYLLPNQA